MVLTPICLLVPSPSPHHGAWLVVHAWHAGCGGVSVCLSLASFHFTTGGPVTPTPIASPTHDKPPRPHPHPHPQPQQRQRQQQQQQQQQQQHQQRRRSHHTKQGRSASRESHTPLSSPPPSPPHSPTHSRSPRSPRSPRSHRSHRSRSPTWSRPRSAPRTRSRPLFSPTGDINYHQDPSGTAAWFRADASGRGDAGLARTTSATTLAHSDAFRTPTSHIRRAALHLQTTPRHTLLPSSQRTLRRSSRSVRRRPASAVPSSRASHAHRLGKSASQPAFSIAAARVRHGVCARDTHTHMYSRVFLFVCFVFVLCLDVLCCVWLVVVVLLLWTASTRCALVQNWWRQPRCTRQVHSHVRHHWRWQGTLTVAMPFPACCKPAEPESHRDSDVYACSGGVSWCVVVWHMGGGGGGGGGCRK